MNKKILFILSILVIGSMIFSACTPKTEPVEEPTEEEVVEPTTELAVGIVLPTKDEPRWIQDQTRFEDKLQAAGYDVEILFSQADPSQEKANVETLITKGVQVIILCPHDSAAAAASAEAARAAGVTIVSYDRLITDTEAVDYYVTFDSVAVGEAQAQYLVDKAEGEGNPLYLFAGAATDNNAFLFFEGAWNVLQPKVADGTFYIVNSDKAVELQDKAELTRDEMGEIIGQITTNWDFDDAKSLAEANLTAAAAEDKGDVSILAPNDGTARAIADAFGADTDVTSFVVTGQDAEIASVQYIIDGKQSMTVLKDVRMLVDDAIALAVSVVEGKTVETTGEYDNGVIMVPAKQSDVITVDKANVQEAIIDSGYWPASEFTGVDEAVVEEEPEPEEFIFGLLMVGPYNDKGWSQAHYEAGLYVEENVPGAKMIYIDTVNTADRPGTTASQLAEELVQQGAQMVIFNSDDMKADAVEFTENNPDVYVIHASGDSVWADGENYVALDNLVNVMGEMEYGKMMAGCDAALHTQSGSIGYLGPLINEETRRLVAAAQLGAEYCWENYLEKDPADLNFKVTWIGFWFNIPGFTEDPTQVANEFINTGYDVIISGIDTTEALVEARKATSEGTTVYAIPYDFVGACEEAPDVCLGTPYFNWGPAYARHIAAAVDGTWESVFEWLPPDWDDINNMDTTAVGFVNGPGMSAEAEPLLQQFIDELAGGLNLWTGPLNFQDGTEFLADGETATDVEVWYMPQLLEGIEGRSE